MAEAASAGGTSCLVVDTSTGNSYASLQAAVKAAAPGDKLLLEGTCSGTETATGSGSGSPALAFPSKGPTGGSGKL